MNVVKQIFRILNETDPKKRKKMIKELKRKHRDAFLEVSLNAIVKNQCNISDLLPAPKEVKSPKEDSGNQGS